MRGNGRQSWVAPLEHPGAAIQNETAGFQNERKFLDDWPMVRGARLARCLP
jgi:hypothetical protein